MKRSTDSKPAKRTWLKKLTIVTMLFTLHPVLCQEKDTINMEELVVIKNSKKLKIKTLTLDGPCYYSENMLNASEIITLADNLPEGTLESANFYFNDLPSRRGQSEKFRDTEFELVLYSVNDDGTPGDRIAHDRLTLSVGSKFSGRLTIDLAILALESPRRLFIGLKRLKPAEGKDEFFIDCLCNGIEYITMVRKDATSAWERRWQCAALKAEVSVAEKR